MGRRRADRGGRGLSHAPAAVLAAACLAAVAVASAPRRQGEPPPVEAPAQEATSSAGERAPDAAVETPRPVPAYEPRYHTLDDVEALVGAWTAALDPGARVEVARVELPPTTGGRPVPALQWGLRGPLALADRPTVFLIGGLDGVSLAGCEAVLAASAAALADPDSLVAGLAYVAIPWASPDGLAATLAGASKEGRSALPLDDDGDRRLDEDGPDDVDGDGLVLEMLIDDPEGEWTRAADPRFLARARTGDTPRYRLSSEGRDDDGDGLCNEDPPGGIDLDLSFPVGWKRSGPLVLGEPMPLEEPPARALADLLLARRTACVLFFQGNHGAIALPAARIGAAARGEGELELAGAASGALAAETLTRLFAQSTDRPQAKVLSLAAARGADRPGAALDWVDAVVGAYAAEVAVWGPSVEQAPDAKGVGLTDARFASANGADLAAQAAPPVAEIDRAWSRWLDNTRGGIGFVEWHPVELGDGRQALVGGWEDFSRLNPPAKTLALALQGMPGFVTKVARGLPALDVRLADTQRDGEVCRIRARIENQGALPVGLLCPGAESASAGAHVRLVLPAGARLLAGESEIALGDLYGGSASRELEWIVLAPAGAALSIEARAPLAATVVREVRP